MKVKEINLILGEALLKEKNPKVSVCVVTYNQEKYIRQCLQSVVDQKTDFDFEVIVGEDCSTDRTREIVTEFYAKYPEKFRVILHAKNVGMIKNYLSVHEAARGDYICHLDGDDYFLANKLQIQKNYLDNHPNCRIVWSRMMILNQENGRLHQDLLSSDMVLNKKYYQKDILSLGSVACHSSKMYRKTALDNIFYPEGEFLDFYLNVAHLSQGYGAIMKEVLGVYRSGVGVLQNLRISEIFTKNLIFACENFPDNRDYASALFLKLFIIQLKRGNFNLFLIKHFFVNFRFKTPLIFARSLFYLKYFKSPTL